MKNSRRKLLKTIGATGITAPLATTVASASQDKKTELVGRSYDPLTFVEQRGANGSVKRVNGGLKGRLNVAGFNIKFGEDEPIQPGPQGRDYAFIYEDQNAANRGGPLLVKFDDTGHGLAGRIKRRAEGYSGIAFIINDNEEFTMQDVSEIIPDSRKPRGASEMPKPPNSGVPQNTALTNLNAEEK